MFIKLFLFLFFWSDAAELFVSNQQKQTRKINQKKTFLFEQINFNHFWNKFCTDFLGIRRMSNKKNKQRNALYIRRNKNTSIIASRNPKRIIPIGIIVWWFDIDKYD